MLVSLLFPGAPFCFHWSTVKDASGNTLVQNKTLGYNVTSLGLDKMLHNYLWGKREKKVKAHKNYDRDADTQGRPNKKIFLSSKFKVIV